MGMELRDVATDVMSDLGMGEDQSKIDAMERSLSLRRTEFARDFYLPRLLAVARFAGHNP